MKERKKTRAEWFIGGKGKRKAEIEEKKWR